MQSSSPFINSFKQLDDPSVSALNSIPGGTYDGNPGDYHGISTSMLFLALLLKIKMPLAPIFVIVLDMKSMDSSPSFFLELFFQNRSIMKFLTSFWMKQLPMLPNKFDSFWNIFILNKISTSLLP